MPGGPHIDFMYHYDQPTLALLYDGLVAQRRTGGAAGLTLVPDLATSLPRPSDGGRVYTFTLRRGIRYSTGSYVRPSDIEHGLLRALRRAASGLPGRDHRRHTMRGVTRSVRSLRGRRHR